MLIVVSVVVDFLYMSISRTGCVLFLRQGNLWSFGFPVWG